MVRIWREKKMFFHSNFFSRISLRIIWITKFCLQKVFTFRKSTWCELFSFLLLIVLDLENFKVLGRLVFCLLTLYISIMHLCRTNNLFTMFVAKFELIIGKFARKSLLSGKLSTFLPLVRWWKHGQYFSLCNTVSPAVMSWQSNI